MGYNKHIFRCLDKVYIYIVHVKFSLLEYSNTPYFLLTQTPTTPICLDSRYLPPSESLTILTTFNLIQTVSPDAYAITLTIISLVVTFYTTYTNIK